MPYALALAQRESSRRTRQESSMQCMDGLDEKAQTSQMSSTQARTVILGVQDWPSDKSETGGVCTLEW